LLVKSSKVKSSKVFQKSEMLIFFSSLVGKWRLD